MPGGYKQDVVFHSDDLGQSFHVSPSTPYGKAGVLQGMDECSFARMSNGCLDAHIDHSLL